MTNLTTSPQLLRELIAAAKQVLSGEDIHNQKVSFIMSAVDENSPITREQVVRVVNEHQGLPTV